VRSPNVDFTVLSRMDYTITRAKNKGGRPSLNRALSGLAKTQTRDDEGMQENQIREPKSKAHKIVSSTKPESRSSQSNGIIMKLVFSSILFLFASKAWASSEVVRVYFLCLCR
jgi:hypothetical protein